ncbi:MAG: HNH endonuclease signature motif containing protein [Micromonosporaceae bacterium]
MTNTPCLEPGCPHLAIPGPRRSRCRGHQKAWDKARNARPERAAYRDPTYRAAVIPATCSMPGCDKPATKDHIVELHQGGGNDASNIQALCITHNVEKSNRQRKRNGQAD